MTNAAGPSSPSTILAPRLVTLAAGSDDELECSVHTIPKQLMREFQHVFAQTHLEQQQEQTTQQVSDEAPELLAIPTNQQARRDLVAIGDEIEAEKDRLLNVFIEFGKDLSERIRAMGFWADYIDPCSGLPMITRDCNKVYSEVDGMECLLNYKSYNAGFCKILTHPKWGSAVYPATVFAYAPRSLVMRLINEYPSK